MALPVAVQLYTLRAEMKEDMRSTLEKVKALGYDGVEFAGLFGKTGEEVRDMCAEIGLVPLSAHVPYVDMVADITILETYKTIGCKYVVVPYLIEEHRPGTDAFAEVIENIKNNSTDEKFNGEIYRNTILGWKVHRSFHIRMYYMIFHHMCDDTI